MTAPTPTTAAAGDPTPGRARRAPRLTPTGRLVVVLVVLGWVAARLIGSRTAYLMVYGSLLAVALAWFLSRRRIEVAVERSAPPGRMRADQVAAVDLRLTGRRRATTLLITEHVDDALGATVLVPVASLAPGEELEHRYVISPRRRGVYRVGPLVASWSDPFGFTTHQQRLADEVEVIVHPPVEPVLDRVLTRMWEDPPVRPPVSKPWPVGFEFYGMRDYVPGDDLRRVVWSVVARTGRMMVRESEQGITDRVVIYIDTGVEHHSPGDVSDTFEAAVRTAASVGVHHLHEGFSVSLLTNKGRVLDKIRGAGSEITFLDALARLDLDRGSMADVGHLLHEEARSRPQLLVITPRLPAREAQRLKMSIDFGVGVTVAQVQWDESDPHTLPTAASLGCEVVRIPTDASLAAVFANKLGAGVRR